ncbi:MAG: GNAT family N-acetyltransferase [Thermomicrobiales bacterium]|nr:GNAT family N-acetyltransferase [Thermomicrobiales bacterium]
MADQPIYDEPTRALTVRRLGPRDLPGVRVIAAASCRHGDAATMETVFAAYLDSGCSFIATIGEEPVGWLLAQPISYCDDAPLTVWVDDVLVRPEHRRRGVAAALYLAFGAWAHGGAVRAALTRFPSEDAAARALHRRAGFAAHATGAVVWRFDDR